MLWTKVTSALEGLRNCKEYGCKASQEENLYKDYHDDKHSHSCQILDEVMLCLYPFHIQDRRCQGVKNINLFMPRDLLDKRGLDKCRLDL